MTPALTILAGILLAVVAYMTGHASGSHRTKLIMSNFIRTKQIEAAHNTVSFNYTISMLDQILTKLRSI